MSNTALKTVTLCKCTYGCDAEHTPANVACREASVTIKQRADELIKQHGGVRRAALAIGVDGAYFSRLLSGENKDPSLWVLRKMGIERVVTYRRK